MNSEIKEIVDAINNMGTINPVKDYMYPLVIVLFGGLVAHFSTAYMRYLDAQKEKLDIANDWNLGLQQVFDSLIAIKGNYYGKLTDDPLQRVSAVPNIIGSSRPLELQINKLSFIAQSKDELLEGYNFHRNPSYISGLQHNYNLLLEILEKRNVLAAQIVPDLGRHYSNGGSHFYASLEEIYRVTNQAEFLGYVQLTEQLIKTTDEILIAIHNFLCEFPDICRYAIDTKRIKHYKKVIECHYDKMEILEKSTPVDYVKLAELLMTSEEEARERFVSGYEEQSGPIEKTTDMLRSSGVNQAIAKHDRDKAIRNRHRYWWR